MFQGLRNRKLPNVDVVLWLEPALKLSLWKCKVAFFVVAQSNADLFRHRRVFIAFLRHGGLLGACEYTCVWGGCWRKNNLREGSNRTFQTCPSLSPKHTPPNPYLYRNKKRLKMAQCMTLLNSITSLIQYRPLGPSSIVLDMFYYIMCTFYYEDVNLVTNLQLL